MENIEVVIIGGGIGGSGLAAVLARAGVSVRVLERTTEFPDRVRGEMYVPWGVAIADQLGLLQPLVDAGATFSTEWVYYDKAFPPEVAEEMGVHVPDAVPGCKGILNFTHPQACQALIDHAVEGGARVARGVEVIDVRLGGTRPAVVWRDTSGVEHTTVAGLVVGADGRASVVRKAAGIKLHSDPVRQYMTGGLVEGDPIRPLINSYGTAEAVNFYSFPQGPNRSRVYLAHFDVHRYAGPDGGRRYLAELALCASPDVARLSAGRLVTPIATHESVDTWTDRPYAERVVLVGDAGGYNDPIVGQGLSLTMADIRDVAEVVLTGGRSADDFAEYGRRRADRHAKQRISARTSAEVLCAFGPDADERRLRALPLLNSDQLIALIVGVLFAGPDIVPPGTELLESARDAFLAA